MAKLPDFEEFKKQYLARLDICVAELLKGQRGDVKDIKKEIETWLDEIGIGYDAVKNVCLKLAVLPPVKMIDALVYKCMNLHGGHQWNQYRYNNLMAYATTGMVLVSSIGVGVALYQGWQIKRQAEFTKVTAHLAPVPFDGKIEVKPIGEMKPVASFPLFGMSSKTDGENPALIGNACLNSACEFHITVSNKTALYQEVPPFELMLGDHPIVKVNLQEYFAAKLIAPQDSVSFKLRPPDDQTVTDLVKTRSQFSLRLRYRK